MPTQIFNGLIVKLTRTRAAAVIETSAADRACVSLVNHQTAARNAAATPVLPHPSMDRGRERSRRRPHGILPNRSGRVVLRTPYSRTDHTRHCELRLILYFHFLFFCSFLYCFFLDAVSKTRRVLRRCTR
jgi:hypothetical protein